MILSGNELRVQRECLFEVAESFLRPVQHGEQKADLVLNTRRLRSEHGGPLPQSERSNRIAARSCCRRLGFQVTKLGLLRAQEWSGGQHENEGQAARPAPYQN